jgi:hypothetical protein
MRLGGGQTTWREQSGVKLSNFYGIELADFAAETTKLSLWIAEYQMNQRFKSLFGEAPKSFPLREGGHINCGNALKLDWLQVCPLPKKTVQKEKIFDLARVEKVHATEEVFDEEVETYIVGNPPYLGGKFQTDAQKEDMGRVFEPTEKFGELDYIASWFIKAANYLLCCRSKFAFVTTNSINQGAQVHQLWPLIFGRGLEISFAYQPFKWSNNAKGNAAVICTIIGIAKVESSDKRMFSDSSVGAVRSINAYLIPGSMCIVYQSLQPLSQLPPILTGNSPYDGGNLILSREEKDRLLVQYPEGASLLRRLYGAHDFLNGVERWCLWITDQQLDLAYAIPEIRERIDRVAEFRREGGDVARGLVETPYRFRYTHTARDSLIILPRVSSERRLYIPFGFLDASAIVSDSAQAIYDAEPWVFSVISSRLHMAWVRTVSGRLKTDIRYSSGLCYNTFPLPTLSEADKSTLDEACWSVISARDENPGKTLAKLYDPDAMPARLLESHRALDDVLERIYIGRSFKSDTERLEHLFKLYADMTSGKPKELALA